MSEGEVRLVRIQRKRTRGWRMPQNTVSVTRPSKYGNPWKVDRFGVVCGTARQAVDLFCKHDLPGLASDARKELRGKNLACFCYLCPKHKNGKPMGVECFNCAPCHADPLLLTANS
jgi:hypothetical protein